MKPVRGGGDIFARRIFSLEMVHFDAFSVAKEAAATGTCPPCSTFPLPNTTLYE